LASWLAFLAGLYLKTRRAVWRELYLFWLKIFAVSFGLGVVSGIVMSFQFGTNWSALSIRAGNILGPPLSYEVLTAFFLEASFLGVMLFGWRRVSPRVHFFATCMVALGTLISTFWIISANSWLHTPVGYEIKDGIFYPKSWIDIIFNPSFPYRLTHMVLAAFITTCFTIGGISAAYLLRNRYKEGALLQWKLAIAFGTIAVPLQILAGDAHGLNVRDHQPIKLAALEGHWETSRGIPFVVWGVPNEADERNDHEVAIPHIGSLILTHEWNGEVRGLKDFPRNERPPIGPVFYAFRVMVGLGFLMLVILLCSLIQWRRGKLGSSTTLLRLWVAVTPIGFIAVLAGWYTAEIGRQPYVIYGLLRTSEAATPIDAASALTSLAVFCSVYLFVFTAAIVYLLKLLRRGPQPADAHELHSPFESASHPISAARDKLERP
jgi:cytochrome d ubiquinol oxidase subunit I